MYIHYKGLYIQKVGYEKLPRVFFKKRGVKYEKVGIEKGVSYI